ncbi:MAG: purine-binding chemotaxis protein CheW [Zetaproteobacteria bacterium]|nr:purine-binding chemotaxis protein CheW [Zetaproteobacteria bacterium]
MSKNYLLFSFNGRQYGVESFFVREIFHLPYFTAVEEAPSYVVGVVNLRGRIEPIMDLHARFGHLSQGYHLSDQVILLESNGCSVGMIVAEVMDVVEVPTEWMAPLPMYGDTERTQSHFIVGEAKIDGNIVMLLDAVRLIHDRVKGDWGDLSLPESIVADSISLAMPTEGLEILKARAASYSTSPVYADGEKNRKIAVVRLANEYFGFELENVREFAHVDQLVPVPCCPPYLAGMMNLRGNLLTLLDIRPLLSLSMDSISTWFHVVVMDANGLKVGILVDEVCDVIDVVDHDGVQVPAAQRVADDEYAKGVVHHQDAPITLLDLDKMIVLQHLIVDEQV